MSVHRTTEPSLGHYLVGAALGALTTLAVAALVMMGLSNENPIIVAQPSGSRLIAYVMMVVGGLAGAALTPGVLSARAERRRREPPVVPGESFYPLAVLAGVVVGLVALGTVLTAAEPIERFIKLLLALTIPAAMPYSEWLSVFVTLAFVPVIVYLVVRLLHLQIRRSRAARSATLAAIESDDTAVTEEGGPVTASQLFDTSIRIGLGATIGAGLALRIGWFAMEILNGGPVYGALYGRSVLWGPFILGTAVVAAGGGGMLGWKLDQYWRVHAKRRRVIPLGAWYGYTPMAWIGGIFAAKLLSGVAFGLARLMFLPIDFRTPSPGSIRPLLIVYFVAGVAWMLIIGRTAARVIDAWIVRERSLRLPRKVDPVA